MEISDKCQYYMLTFELHEQLCERPSTFKWSGIPETCKLHQIGNMGGKVLYFHKFSYCCFRCLQHTVPCQNNIRPDEWTAFDLAKKKSADANLKHWFGNDTYICNMSVVDNARVQDINWSSILQALAQQQSFVQLKRYIIENPIPDLICQPEDKLTTEETINLDLVAMHHMPNDVISVLAPILIEGNGNCFPCTIKLLNVQIKSHGH